MNLNHIEAFLKIVELGSITKAADALFISQSTLSDRLKSLEDELGFTLILRGPGIKKNELTDRGTEFLEYANRYLALNQEVEQWRNYDDVETISVGAPQSINSLFFRDFYKHIIESDHVHLHVSAHWNRTIYNMVNASELNVGIVSRPYQSKNIETRSIFKEKLLVIYDEKYASYQDLADLPVEEQIYIEWGPSIIQWYQKYWNTFDLPKINLDSPELVHDYIQTQNSWAIVPLCLYNDIVKHNDRIQIIDSKEEIYRELYLIRSRRPKDSKKNNLDAFIESMGRFIKECDQQGLCQASF